MSDNGRGVQVPERLMRIGELAERAGMSLPTIRHYDEMGLVSPSARTVGRFRLYSEADFEKLMVIRRMKPLGYSVEQMRDLLVVVERLRRSPGPPPEERELLLRALDEVIDDAGVRREKLQRNLSRADEFIAVLHERRTVGAVDTAVLQQRT